MILGIGIDIVEISRIINSNETFIKKYFTVNEMKIFSDKKKSIASNFAAKEAFVKALGTGFIDGIAPIDIEVLRQQNGQPYIKLSGTALEAANFKNVNNIFVSLSDCNDYAIANVVLEGSGS